jgi:hypothetical protein
MPAMAWDARRQVPWKRLFTEWAIFAPIMVGVLWLMRGDSEGFGGAIVGVLVSLPLYLGLGFVLAKFGYHRRTLAEMRTPRAAATPASGDVTTAARPRPAPTRRTAGSGRPGQKRRK